MDRDVESFLKYKAELYEQHNISRTYFILNIRNNEYEFLAFFTITIKEFHFDENLSRGNKKKYLGTSYENKRNISAILIGQLGKNYAIPHSLQISGKLIMNCALDIISIIRDYAGGRLLYVEAKDNKYLHTFYTASSFSLYHDESNQPIVNKQGLFTYLLPCSKCF